MSKQTIPAMVEGGKASMGPPLGPALGGSGVNAGQVIAAINDKTKAFAGMSVPIKVIIDKASKTFEIEVGTPPTSSLIKAELGLKEPVKEEAGVKGKKTIGDLRFEQLLKLSEMKFGGTLAKTTKTHVLEILGTCVSLGVTVDGKKAQEVQKEIKEGKHNKHFKG